MYSTMIDAHDRLFGHGSGEAFFSILFVLLFVGIALSIDIGAEIVKPALPQCIEHEGACVEITMVRDYLTTFAADEGRA